MTNPRDPRVADVVRRLVEQAPPAPAFPDASPLGRGPFAGRFARRALVGVVVAVVIAAIVVLGLGTGSRSSVHVTVPDTSTTMPPAVGIVRPSALAISPDRTLYVSDLGAHRVVAVTSAGAVRVIAHIDQPHGLALDHGGNLYVADAGTNTVRRIAPDGTTSTIAGDGTAGFAGDGGRATAAKLSDPSALAFGPDRSLYIADAGNERVRRVWPDGTIGTVAGNGSAGDTGDGGSALDAGLDPRALAFDRHGNLDVFQFDVKVMRRIAPDGIISSLSKSLYASALATAPDGTIDVADYGAFGITRISPTGVITAAPFRHTGIFRPVAIAVATNGAIYVADDGASGGGPMRILLVHPNGTSIDITPPGP